MKSFLMPNNTANISFLGEGYRRVKPAYLTSGDIIWVPKSGHIDSIAYLLVERFSDDRFFGLINMFGYKAGRKYVAFPDECREANEYALSMEWLSRNWDKWVALGHYEDAIFLRSLRLSD